MALAISEAISLRGKHVDTHSRGRLEELREAFRQEPVNNALASGRWQASAAGGRAEGKGTVLLRTGSEARAESSFHLMRAAFFHFRMEEPEAALHCSARVLKIVPALTPR